MTEGEKRVLKALVNDQNGIMTPAALSSITGASGRVVQDLIAKEYIEEITQSLPTLPNFPPRTVTCYRATHKGLAVFNPWYKKMWFAIRGDIITVIIAAITALITSLIAFYVQRALTH